MRTAFKIFGIISLAVLNGLHCRAQTFLLVEEFKKQSKILNSNGVAVADYDLDGDLDIYVTSAEEYDQSDPTTWSRLLKNEGVSGYKDATIFSRLINNQGGARKGAMGAHMGASWGDYDNDGYPDLFLSNNGFDFLWHNEGDGKFANVTEVADVAGCSGCYSSNGVWWDYDQDGDLDLYVSQWIGRNRFYRNDGDNVFTDISVITGLDDLGLTWTSLPIDLDRDGLQDLYLVNDKGENRFFRNLGNDDFVDLTAEVGLEDIGDGMGVAVGDYNNDGFFDIYVTQIHYFHPNPFFVNDGTGVFTNMAKELRLDDTGWGWGVRFFDTDHDLDEDIYVVNGFDSPIAEGDRNMFFENLGSEIFTNVAPNTGLNGIEYAMGLEVFDYDNDGDYDMLVANRDANMSLFKNTVLERGGENINWIKIELEGSTSNRNAFGSEVRIRCDGNFYYRHYSGTNLLGQSIIPVHFGLSSHIKVDEIVVTWPNGEKEFVEDVQANQLVHLKQGTLRKKVVTGIGDEAIDASVSIYPNPFSDRIDIQFNEPVYGSVVFRLTNTLGQLIHLEEKNIAESDGLTIQLTDLGSGLISGMYFYSLISSKGHKTGSLLKR
ncbi:MAG: FG-GAP-like repeat-containing protein [Bacteroidetes bacterium]|nr:FG-GAP-like repeat-containing protein [Bacteroidota bacterium]